MAKKKSGEKKSKAAQAPRKTWKLTQSQLQVVREMMGRYDRELEILKRYQRAELSQLIADVVRPELEIPEKTDLQLDAKRGVLLKVTAEELKKLNG